MNCCVEGCIRPVKYSGKQLCQTHYHRLYRGKALGTAAALLTRHTSPTCEVVDCDRPRGNGLAMCSMHDTRTRRHGAHSVVLAPPPKRGADNNRWTGDAATYNGVHQRLRHQFGAARQHTCTCGNRAAHWSYDHADPNERQGDDGPYSTDLSHYMAKCVRCHKIADMGRR